MLGDKTPREARRDPRKSRGLEMAGLGEAGHGVLVTGVSWLLQ